MLPLLMEPQSPGAELNLWADKRLDSIAVSLLIHGAILFRGFRVTDERDFARFTDVIFSEALEYVERSTPRTRVTGRIYTSTEYPARQVIALHNESSYASTWPGKVCFCCLVPPGHGGETPIADVRKVYRRIDPRIVESFASKGWMLIRNYGQGMGLTWEDAFQTSDRAIVESHCRSAGIDLRWKGDCLETRQVRPAVARHPKTGEMVWFNHMAFWHVSSLQHEVRQAMLEVLGADGLPYNTFFGDGNPIDSSIVEDVRDAYNRERVTFQWQGGDVLLLDNMLVAHGRNAFSGERRILVAMGDPSVLEGSLEGAVGRPIRSSVTLSGKERRV